MGTERRKLIRFLAPENTFAVLRPNFRTIGRIKDISIGGLAFQYLTDEKPGFEYSRVDIFIREEEFHLSELPCKTVYDIPLAGDADTRASAGGLIHRRCGVQFGVIDKDDFTQLEIFLSLRTTGTVP